MTSPAGEIVIEPSEAVTWAWLLGCLATQGTVLYASDAGVRLEMTNDYVVRFAVTPTDWHRFVVEDRRRALRAGVRVEPLTELPSGVADELMEVLATRGPDLVLRDGRIEEQDDAWT